MAALALVGATAGQAPAARSGLCDPTSPAATRVVGVFSAFPAELAPLVEAADIEETRVVDGATLHIGRLGGVRVVLGLLGIGLVNARTSAERLLANFDVAALVVSGVAGSAHNIGDVVVAHSWVLGDEPKVYRPNRALLALVERAGTRLPEPFQKCTPVPPTDPLAPLVCMPHDPALVFETRGASADPFGGNALPCTPGAGEIFGCEVPMPLTAARAAVIPDVQDMETAAVAAVAAAHRIPMIGVRGVSDGAGDPQGDRGFPAQFFDYYRLAAFNAAVVTRGIVGELGALAESERGDRLCRRLARRRWRSAARLIRSAP